MSPADSVTLASLLALVAPVGLTILAGFLVRRLGWLTQEADRSLLRLTVNVLTPCLVLDSVLGNRALHQAGNLVAAPVLGFLTVLAGFGACRLAARVVRLGDRRTCDTFAVVAGLYNYGYIPLPLVLSLFGPATVGVLFAFNLGVELCLWTLGVTLLGDSQGKALWRRAVSVPALAIVLAMLLNLLHAGDWMPRFVTGTAHLMGAAAIPLGLLLSGASLADLLAEDSLRGGAKPVALGALLRLGLLPLLFLAAARWLPVPAELQRVLVVQAAMPSAIVPIILTRHYGGDTATALKVVVGTTLIALVTLPWWLRAGLALLPPG